MTQDERNVESRRAPEVTHPLMADMTFVLVHPVIDITSDHYYEVLRGEEEVNTQQNNLQNPKDSLES